MVKICTFLGLLKQVLIFKVEDILKLALEKNHLPIQRSRQLHRKLMQTGSVLHKNGAGRPRASDKNVERVLELSSKSPKKSVRTALRQLQMSRSIVHKYLRKA